MSVPISFIVVALNSWDRIMRVHSNRAVVSYRGTNITLPSVLPLRVRDFFRYLEGCTEQRIRREFLGNRQGLYSSTRNMHTHTHTHSHTRHTSKEFLLFLFCIILLYTIYTWTDEWTIENCWRNVAGANQ